MRTCYSDMDLCRLSDALEPPWAFLKLMSEWRIWWRAAMNISCMTHMRERERERAGEMLRDAVLGSADTELVVMMRGGWQTDGGRVYSTRGLLLLCVALYPEGKHPRKIGRNRSPDPKSKWLISKPLCYDVMNMCMYGEMISVFTVCSKWQPWNIWVTLYIAVIGGYCIFTVQIELLCVIILWSCL